MTKKEMEDKIRELEDKVRLLDTNVGLLTELVKLKNNNIVPAPYTPTTPVSPWYKTPTVQMRDTDGA